MSKKHFLVIRFSSIGDIVLTTAILQSLKNRFGEIEITYLTFDHLKAPLMGHPLINSLLPVSKKGGFKGILEIVKTVKRIHREKPIDLALDLHSNTRTFFLKLLFSKIFYLSLDKRKIERFLLTQFKINLYPFFQKGVEKINERVQRDFAPALGWGSEAPKTHIERERTLDKKIFFMPAAAHPKKQWPLKSFEDLIQSFLTDLKYEDYQFVILGGPNDNFCEPLKKLATDRPKKVVYAQGKFTLDEVISEVATGQLLIGNDTGLCHIAEALNIPVIMFMGPTSEYYGFSPILEKSLLKYEPIKCRPCHHYGAGKCTQPEKFCLTKVDYKEVKDDADRILGVL